MQLTSGIVAFAMFAALNLPAAPRAAAQDTLWNQTDRNGLKQGYWKKHYPGGGIIYSGFFVDDRPVGKMQRFYEDGKIKVLLIHSEDSETTWATMYFRNGQSGARGKYTREKRDSIWNYYSYYTGTLSCRESYRMGLREGPTVKYYPEGPAAEILYWKNGKKHGKWEQFYEDSNLRLSSFYEQDKLQGKYRVYNRESILVVEGSYEQGKMDGSWKFYNSAGELQRELRYVKGKLQNQEDLEKWAREFMENVEKDMGKIPEPDFDNFFDRIP